ncbi:hypothetical protein KTS45_19555 [Halomicroarcula limicola]|uniref:Uncharacterized protein n=1 Tax=Haloarcula limicola TaxID=1429915 RepID=A0A8J7Y968_9EURY|nr:hypothetical protein [Halomicroarcula limicola]MBV0926407.1 hypothetical protein [Halomicroarcula limicola]
MTWDFADDEPISWIGENIHWLIIPSIVGFLSGWAISNGSLQSIPSLISSLSANQWSVIVTIVYVILTFRLVNETRQARKQENRRELDRQERRLNSLKKALLTEVEQNIEKIDALNLTNTNVEFGGNVFHSEIYRQNADRIGELDPSTGKVVTEAFTEIVEIQRLIEKGIEIEDDRHGIGYTGYSSSALKDAKRKLESAKSHLKQNSD